MNPATVPILLHALTPYVIPTLQKIALSLATKKSSFDIKSLTELSRKARITAPVLIERRLANADHGKMTALMQTILSIYSGYYLQSVNLLNPVLGVSALSLLDSLSSDRSIDRKLLAKAWPNEIIAGSRALKNHGFESFEDCSIPTYLSEVGLESDQMVKTIHNITDDSNLAVGKILDVQLGTETEDGKKTSITIPVSVNLAPHVINSEDYLQIIELLSTDKSIPGRWHQWRSGDITVADYLFCLDIVEKERKALLADKTGFFSKQLLRQDKNVAVEIAHGTNSNNLINAIHVISAQTAADLQIRIGGKLTSNSATRLFSIREKFFNETMTMMLVVVDLNRDRFTLYQRGIDSYGDYTFTDIKNNDKNPKGVDIQAIMNSYKLGQAATL